MNRFSILLVFCMAWPMLLCAQQADIVFSEMEYDFGDIPELGGVAQHRFVYTNTGTVPLILNSVHTSCGCTSPAWSKEPVPPSKSGFIDVTFDPRDRVGSFTKSIIVNSNAKEQSQTLYISGNVTPRPAPLSSQYPYNMDDLRLKATTVNFGNVASSQNLSQDIEVVNPSKADIVIQPSTQDIPPYITIHAKPSVLKPGDKGKIHVEFSAKKSGLFDLVQCNAPIMVGAQKFNLHIKAVVTESFSNSDVSSQPEIKILNAGELNFGSLQKGETAVCKLRFQNVGKSTLHIRAIRNACDCIQYKVVDPEVAPGGEGTIHIFFDTEGRSGVQNRYITIVTNQAQNTNVVLKIEANIVE
ncbi:MAG: DUF1573 domain-containing protein [Bacteroidales bacterium]|nr:DUF1573 domain-containing protein [Bacteroidales bacterium]